MTIEENIWRDKFMHYAQIASVALKNLKDQVGNDIDWTYLNDLYEMEETVNRERQV